MIARLTQLWADYIHEGAIKAAGDDVKKYALRGDKQKERDAYDEMIGLVRLRSPEQVESMERAQGIYR